MHETEFACMAISHTTDTQVGQSGASSLQTRQ